MKMPDNLFAAIYCRVSTLDQGERYSLPTQLKLAKQKAEQLGLRWREDLIFVDKHTGKIGSRPEFDKMRALIKGRGIAAVIVLNIDRFARNLLDALIFRKEFKKYGTALEFVEIPIENTAFGDFTFAQLASVAELVGQKIVEDSLRGRREKLAEGQLTNSSAPFGYIYIDKHHKDGCRYDLDPTPVPGFGTRADVVRQVFKWRSEFMSYYAISARLNKAGVKSKGFNGHEGGSWGRQVVRKMLTRTSYIGEHRTELKPPKDAPENTPPEVFVIKCPAIVPRDLFDKVQNMGAAIRHQWQGQPSTKYLLRGFIYCGKCGKRGSCMPGRGGYWAYQCTNRTNRWPIVRLCDACSCPGARTEDLTFDAVWDLCKDPQRLLESGRKCFEKLARDNDRAQACQRKLVRLESKLSRLRRGFKEGLLPEAETEREIRDAMADIASAQLELRSVAKITGLPPLEAAQEALGEIAAGPKPRGWHRRGILNTIRNFEVKFWDGGSRLEISGEMDIQAKNCTRRQGSGYSSLVPFYLEIKVGAA